MEKKNELKLWPVLPQSQTGYLTQEQLDLILHGGRLCQEVMGAERCPLLVFIPGMVCLILKGI